MSRSLALALLLSLLGHSALLVDLARQGTDQIKTVPIPIEIQATSSPSPRATGVSNHSRRLSPRATRIHRLDLGVTPMTYAEASRLSANSLGGSGASDSRGSPWGSGGKDLARLKDYLKMERLKERIEAKLVYPRVLAKRQMQGTVNARLVVDSVGECQWDLSQVNSSQIYLRVYVFTLLKELCREKLVLERQSGQTIATAQTRNLDLSFRFEITENNEDYLRDNQQVIAGNVLFFYRNSHQSLGDWHLGPLKGFLALGASIDFEWIKENWDRLVNGLDPLQPYRPQRFG